MLYCNKWYRFCETAAYPQFTQHLIKTVGVQNVILYGKINPPRCVYFLQTVGQPNFSNEPFRYFYEGQDKIPECSILIAVVINKYRLR